MRQKIVIKRMLTRVAILWQEINAADSLWRNNDKYRRAVDQYHCKALTKSGELRNKLLACAMLVTDDIADAHNKILPELCYLTIIYSKKIKSAKKLLYHIMKGALPLDCEVFESICLHLFNTEALCINACPEEV